MQSRAVAVSARVLTSFPRTCGRPVGRWWSNAAAAAGPGDPAVPSQDPQGDDAAKAAMAKQQQQERLVREGGEKEPGRPSATGARKLPFAASPKLESTEVPPPQDPAFQQKRRLHGADALEGVSCVGWDGTPLVVGTGDEGLQLDEQQEDRTEDDKEYFKHHKPTPLSELEIADTRRPIPRATDSDVADDDSGVGEGPMVWREEQLDTVDEALLRAEAMFKEAAERGDPDTPHHRVLTCYQRMVLL